MLGQVLITALVVGIFYIWWRHQQRLKLLARRSAQEPQPAAALSGPQAKPPVPVKLLVVIIVATSLLAGAGYALYDWRDKHQLLKVTLVNPVEGSRESFQVYKKDLQEDRFTTRDGQHVRIASSERLEVRRLD